MHFQDASKLPYSVAVELTQKGTRNNLSLKAWPGAVQHHFCHIWTQEPKSRFRFKRKNKNTVCGGGWAKDLQPSLNPTTSHWRKQTSYSPFPSLHPWNTAPGQFRVFLSTHLSRLCECCCRVPGGKQQCLFFLHYFLMVTYGLLPGSFSRCLRQGPSRALVLLACPSISSTPLFGCMRHTLI